jgi:hypothetical protein
MEYEIVLVDFDPVTGKLWDTENGPTFGDGINLVNPGFNSGWLQVTGIWKAGPHPGPVIGADATNPPNDLVTFEGKGVYRAPRIFLASNNRSNSLKIPRFSSVGCTVPK